MRALHARTEGEPRDQSRKGIRDPFPFACLSAKEREGRRGNRSIESRRNNLGTRAFPHHGRKIFYRGRIALHFSNLFQTFSLSLDHASCDASETSENDSQWTRLTPGNSERFSLHISLLGTPRTSRIPEPRTLSSDTSSGSSEDSREHRRVENRTNKKRDSLGRDAAGSYSRASPRFYSSLEQCHILIPFDDSGSFHAAKPSRIRQRLALIPRRPAFCLRNSDQSPLREKS